MAAQDRNITLLAETTVTAAVSATVTAEIVFAPKVITTATMYGVLTYGSGGVGVRRCRTDGRIQCRYCHRLSQNQVNFDRGAAAIRASR